MSGVLPELKKGNVLVKTGRDGQITRVTVIRVGDGREFDEPVYYLQGMYGVKLKQPYSGDELSNQGFALQAEETKDGGRLI